MKSLWNARFLLLITYPTIYYSWVKRMEDSWIFNDIKDLYPQILFPTRHRYTKMAFQGHQSQFQQVLITKPMNQHLQTIIKYPKN